MYIQYILRFSQSQAKNLYRICTTSFNQRFLRETLIKEVLSNLQSELGARLTTNRSIQAEGTFGSIKWNRSYKRAKRRGIESVILEFTLISIGFNLYKYHNKKSRMSKAA
ncbi:MAG: transposase [Eubacteriales bacterium]